MATAYDHGSKNPVNHRAIFPVQHRWPRRLPGWRPRNAATVGLTLGAARVRPA